MEIRDAVRYLPVSGVFYMSHPGKPMSDEFRDQTVGDSGVVSKMEAFIAENKIDTILTWETPGNWKFPPLWRDKGVRWFSVVHWDWFAPKQQAAWKTAKILVPFETAGLGLKLIYNLDSRTIPVPVDLARLDFRLRTKAEKFVTVYAMGGPGDRRSIRSVVEAWRLLGEKAPSLTIHAQKEPLELQGVPLPETIDLKLGSLQKPVDLYSKYDVAVMPSKYEGVGLSLIEAQACGLPVITTNMDPMRSIAPNYLVAGTTGELEIMEGHKIAICSPTPEAIAMRVKELAHTDISGASEAARQHIQKKYSWANLKDEWIGVLESA